MFALGGGVLYWRTGGGLLTIWLATEFGIKPGRIGAGCAGNESPPLEPIIMGADCVDAPLPCLLGAGPLRP